MVVGNQLNSSDAEVRDKDASGVAKRADKGVSQFSRVNLQLTNTSEKANFRCYAQLHLAQPWCERQTKRSI